MGTCHHLGIPLLVSVSAITVSILTHMHIMGIVLEECYNIIWGKTWH